MNLLIAGASGFIGQQLVLACKMEHSITVLGRDSAKLKKLFPPPIQIVTWDGLESIDATSFDAVINLAGFNIADKRWSNDIKHQIIDSRVETNQRLTDWLIKYNAKPHFICANAIGIYGAHDATANISFDEDSVIKPIDFLSEIGIAWQDSLQNAIQYGIPVTTTRFGVVLKRGSGMLKKIETGFYFGLGSIIGNGQQIMSWVHIEDVIGAIKFLLVNPSFTGPYNVVSPNPITQQRFATTLAKTLKRPLFLKLPATLVHLLFGEMGDYLLLKGQSVTPKRLQNRGYQFLYSDVNSALVKEYQS